MSEPMTVGEVLTGALDWLKKDGWCTHTVQNQAGQHCAVGAVAKAITGDAYGLSRNANSSHHRIYVQATEALATQIPEDSDAKRWRYTTGVMVCSYNNTRTSFEEEIVPWFEKAIAN